MGLLQQVRDRVTQAMRDNDTVVKNVLRVVVGEANQLEMGANQAGKPLADEQVHKLIRKLMQSNIETLQHLSAEDVRKPVLERENEILNTFLPVQLNAEGIKAKLVGIRDQLKEAKSVGQAVGVAMKVFKQAGDSVDGKVVQVVVEELRQ